MRSLPGERPDRAKKLLPGEKPRLQNLGGRADRAGKVRPAPAVFPEKTAVSLPKKNVLISLNVLLFGPESGKIGGVFRRTHMERIHRKRDSGPPAWHSLPVFLLLAAVGGVLEA